MSLSALALVPALVLGEFVTQNNDPSLDPSAVFTPAGLQHYTAFNAHHGGRVRVTRTRLEAAAVNDGDLSLILAEFEAVYPSGTRHAGWLALEVDTADPSGARVSFFTTAGPPPAGTSPSSSAAVGQGADFTATAVALSQGLTEVNPILSSGGLPAIAVAKILVTPALQRSSFESCVSSSPLLASSGWGAAAYNIGVMAGLGPAALIPALGAAIFTHPEHDKVFWECASTHFKN